MVRTGPTNRGGELQDFGASLECLLNQGETTMPLPSICVSPTHFLGHWVKCLDPELRLTIQERDTKKGNLCTGIYSIIG